MDKGSYYGRGLQPPVVPGHVPAFTAEELGFSEPTPEQEQIMDEMVVAATKPRLHWFQWVVYSIVLITCLALLYGMVEAYLTIIAIQDAATKFVDGITSEGMLN